LLSKDKDIHGAINCVAVKKIENILMKIPSSIVVIEKSIDSENEYVYLQCNNIFLMNVQSESFEDSQYQYMKKIFMFCKSSTRIT
jgi:hypothetical protein